MRGPPKKLYICTACNRVYQLQELELKEDKYAKYYYCLICGSLLYQTYTLRYRVKTYLKYVLYSNLKRKIKKKNKS